MTLNAPILTGSFAELINLFLCLKVAAPQSTIDDDYKQFMAEMKDVL